MSEISAEMIKDLRVKTGAGVLDCKKALTESQGDLVKAVEILRKSGAAKADKKSGRITAEGRIGLQVSQNKAALVEVNSETDFVAKNEGFQAFVDTVAQPGLALQHQAQGEVGGGLVVQFGRVQVHVLEAQRRANGRRIECCDGVHAGVTCSSRAAAARSTRS